MTPGVVAAVVLSVVGACGLSATLAVGSYVPLALAGLLLFAVAVWRNHSWLVHALIIVVFTATPADIPAGFHVGGTFVYADEPFVVGAVIYAVILLREAPESWRRLLASNSLWAGILFSGMVVLGISIGMIRGLPVPDIQIDVRPIAASLAVAFVCATVVLCGDWRRYLKTIAAVLWISTLVTIYASVSGSTLGGRTETAQLTTTAGDVVSGGSSAVRYLTSATPLALIVLLACVVLLVRGQVTGLQAVPMLLPAMLISVLSFSRNTWLALGMAVAFALLVSFLDSRLTQALVRLAAGLMIAAAVLASVVVVGRAAGAGDWIDTQISGTTQRVFAGFNQSTGSIDASTLYRLREDENLRRAGDAHELFGGGFGLRYQPPSGDPGEFTADRGQLYAHNLYGWFYAKAGAFGVAAFVFMLVACVAPALGRRRSDPVLGAASSTLVGLAVTGIYVPFLLDDGPAIAFGSVLGVCIGAAAYVRRAEDEPSATPRGESSVPELAPS